MHLIKITTFLLLFSIKLSAQNGRYEVINDDSLAVFRIEHPPYFADGQIFFDKYLKKNFTYPKEAKKNNIRGIMPVSFVVDKNGKVSNIKPRISLGYGCDEEAIRFIENMPAWSSCNRDGIPLDVTYLFNLTFGKVQPEDTYYEKGLLALK